MIWTLAGNQIGDLEYDYDADGRVIEKTGSFAQTNLPQPVTGNTFNADNEMTAFNGTVLSYDANGNLTAGASNTYAWDARNHLSAISGANTASFVYDSLGRRMSKTIGATATSFLYDGLNPVQELQSGSPSANMLTGLGIDEYFQRTDASGASSYLTDALGSTLALANPAAGLATSYTYDPFGNTTMAGSSSNPFQFSGRENDGTGLYYYRARYYSPTFQRFVSQDPIGFAGGDFDLYGYVGNSPITLTDPLGLSDLYYVPSGCGCGSSSTPAELLIFDKNGDLVGDFPAGNNTVNHNPFPTGTWPYAYHNPHPESGPTGSYGSNGIFIFSVPGHMGLGVHSGRSGPLSKTMGCIRTTDPATKLIDELNRMDPLQTLTIGAPEYP